MAAPLAVGRLIPHALLAYVSQWPLWIFNVLPAVPNPLITEDGPFFVLLGVLFYVFREKRRLHILLLAAYAAWTFFAGDPMQWIMVFAAIPPMLFYNGKRGGGNKYFFYIFYPAHMYIIYTVAWFMRDRTAG
ncbi:MAG: conjugal transfer protein TraX [Oscillospiraceae bacterium]|jgi:hypothetical protein|nr:conjugal transfer protein TraX [Oscillospiraceae bacterium]